MMVDIEDLEIARFQAASIIATEKFEHYAAAGLVDADDLAEIRMLEAEAQSDPFCDDDVHALQIEVVEKLNAGGRLSESDKLRFYNSIRDFFGMTRVDALLNRRAA